jgi:hypothetical protein
MIGYPVYKLFHVLAILALFAGLVTLFLQPVTTDGARARRVAHWITGVAAVVALVSGFGLHARLGGVWQGWVVTKISVWCVLMLVLVVFRAGASTRPAPMAWIVTLPAVALAVFMAIYKPF